MSDWVQTKLPCPNCSSSDAYAISSTGWGHCFSCNVNIKETEEGGLPVTQTGSPQTPSDLLSVTYEALTKRGITQETARKFKYGIGFYRGKRVHVAPYYNPQGQLVAQKLRFADKSFLILGDMKQATLFGQTLWGQGGKKLCITEGELDALSLSQIQGNKWAVVSLPTGAQSAMKAIKKNLEYCLSFEEIILFFDMDEVGQKAAQEVADLLPLGKVKIACLPLKDANEMLVAKRSPEVLQEVWNAKPYRPDGILEIDDILEEIEQPIEQGAPWCFEELTQLTFGRRKGELYAIGAGTGVGKTDFMTQQIAYDVMELNKKVGVIYLEAKPSETGKRIAGKVDHVRYHVPNGGGSLDQLKATLQKLKGKVVFYDSWGETDWKVVKNKIRYMVTAHGISHIFLDHLTAMADTSDEKASIEQIMKEMAGLANELSCIVHFVSHLATPEGKPHEEGGRVTIRHFKGSRAIGFWSYFMFGLERNQQAEDEADRQTTTLRVLKDRYTGQATGKTLKLGYDAQKGTLYVQPTSAETYGFEEDQEEDDIPF